MPDIEELKPMDDVLEISPTLRGRISEIVILVIMSLIFLKLHKLVPVDGLSLNEILHVNFTFLSKKISATYLQTPLKVLCLGSFLYGMYVYLQQKLTVYKLTYLYLQKNSGVFYRTSDSTDLTAIRDQRKTRNIIEMALGLSRLTIVSTDVTDPEMVISGITKEDAEKIINFLRKYAFRSYTEYRISRDRDKTQKSRKDRGFVDDGDFE